MRIDKRNVIVPFKNNRFEKFSDRNDYVVMPEKSATNPEKKSKLLNANNSVVWSSLGMILAGSSILAVNFLKAPKKNPSNTISNTINYLDVLKSKFDKILQKFPEDEAYYDKLAQEIGLKTEAKYRLNSIVGKSQLESLLKSFTPKDYYISKSLVEADNMTYRVNLHNTTKASDGKLSVADFLEQARLYADKIAAKIPADDKPPFTVAITDHDSLAGAKEAVKILSNNPEKYRNLSVVLGFKPSMIYTDSNVMKKPLHYELIGYSIDPFDKEIESILKNVYSARRNSMTTLIEKFNLSFPQYNFSYKEAENFHPHIKNAHTTECLNFVGDYAEFKMKLVEYVKEINEKFFKKSKTKVIPEGIPKHFSEEYYYNLDRGGVKSFTEFLKRIWLKRFFDDKRILNKKNENIYNEIFNIDFKKNDKKIKKIIESSMPTMHCNKNTTIEAQTLFSATKDGFYGMPYPALLFNKRDSSKILLRLSNSLKEIDNNLFKACEVNYQSYADNISEAQINFIKNDLANNPELKLLHTGGVGCHNGSIFSKYGYLRKDLFNKLLGK